MLDYLKSKRSKPSTVTEAPILTPEDEEFFHKLATEDVDSGLSEQPPPLPARPGSLLEAGNPEGNDKQVALIDPADQVLPDDLPEDPQEVLPTTKDHDLAESHTQKKIKKSKWSWKKKNSREGKLKTTAADLMSAAEHTRSENARPDEDPIVPDSEAQKEEKEMADILDQLNLAAVDNKVFSISEESRELLTKFTFVLKDIIKGAPEAYRDLESLLTNSEDQLQRSYKHLPSWLQKLVEQLPSKLTKSITPEVLAAAAEKAGADGGAAKVAIPTLKEIVTKPGIVITMLKAILNFLRVKFPAFLGLNVLYSLALFVLLFIFWYCHKRGREVRMEKERLVIEEEVKKLDTPDSSRSSSLSSQRQGGEDPLDTGGSENQEKPQQ